MGDKMLKNNKGKRLSEIVIGIFQGKGASREYIDRVDKAKIVKDYSNYLEKCFRKLYLISRDNLEELEEIKRQKVFVYDHLSIRAFTVSISKGYEKSLKEKNIITDEGELFNENKAKKELETIAFDKLPDLLDYIEIRRHDFGFQIPLYKEDYENSYEEDENSYEEDEDEGYNYDDENEEEDEDEDEEVSVRDLIDYEQGQE